MGLEFGRGGGGGCGRRVIGRRRQSRFCRGGRGDGGGRVGVTESFDGRIGEMLVSRGGRCCGGGYGSGWVRRRGGRGVLRSGGGCGGGSGGGTRETR